MMIIKKYAFMSIKKQMKVLLLLIQLSLNEIEPLKEEVYDLIKLTQNN